MGERTSYTPGTFCWADLSSTDQPAAKAFYSGLFGWEAEDSPVGDGVYYSMMHLDGKRVAAIAPQPEQQREAGVPPQWQSYVSVESADAAAERASELGADVHAGPFDVMDVGRMAVIRDPQGAHCMVWQPRTHHRRGARQRPRGARLERAGLPRPGRLRRLLRRPLRLDRRPVRGQPRPVPVDQERRGQRRRHPAADPTGGAPPLAGVLRRGGPRHRARPGGGARRYRARRPDRHPGREDRDRLRLAGRDLRALRGRARAVG